jgi:Fe-S cluster assembly scaffold protein SufB
MYPKVILNDNAKTQMYSLIIGKNNAKYDIGSEAILNGKNSSAEIISRAIALEESEIITRAKIIGKNYSKGHIECFGLIESEKAKISTYPILISKNQEATLTHEAAIGKISREEIEYLMAKGFNEEEAKSIIIRGFSNIEVKELPEIIRKQIQYIKDRFLKTTL